MPTFRPVRVADHFKVSDFIRDWYLIRIRCVCGHEREPRGDFLRRMAGAQATIADLRRRLRCHRCGKHDAQVLVYRLPR